MTKRNPICMITGCNKRGKRKIRFDIGPTLGEAVVPDEMRLQTMFVCDEHFDMVTKGINNDGINGTSIGSRREPG